MLHTRDKYRLYLLTYLFKKGRERGVGGNPKGGKT